ncbi:MAG: hypothetical protein KF852_18245 [Saprospiraceae bacterium]|nr:hypothetical protein [Saprospiraceae bacterium]
MQSPTFHPYQNEGLNHLYELLFCDNEAAFSNNGAFPWPVLFADPPDAEALLQLANDTNQESRLRALAANKLRAIGGAAPKPELHGVIVEVGMEGGLDVLAAFSDGTARYLNHSERAIISDAPTEATNPLIATLWHHSINVVNKIGPWDKPRLEPPQTGMVRLSFLVSGQLYFGQAPMDVFFNDPMAGPVLNSAAQLMAYLTETATQN